MVQSDDKEQLFDEAADIFVRLQDRPDDAAIRRERDAFLARGSEAQNAYRQVQKVWTATGRRPAPRAPVIAALGVCLALGAFYGAEPLRVFATADLTSGGTTERSALASGDVVTLDAGSALVDDTDAGTRRTALLRGAAYFEVASDARPFEVDMGDISVRVLGTAFETVRLADGATVSVFEGQVEVTHETEAWVLGPGETLHLRHDTNADKTSIDVATIAGWKEDRLIADGLPLAIAVDSIDRRLPGRIAVLGTGQDTTRVSGGFDLNDPRSALRVLAAGLGARVLATPPVTLLILPGG